MNLQRYQQRQFARMSVVIIVLCIALIVVMLQVSAYRGTQKRTVLPFEEHAATVTEILESQRIPSISRQQKGVVLVLDLTVRGDRPAQLSKLFFSQKTADLARKGVFQLWRDNGDRVWSADDTRIPVFIADSPDRKERYALSITDASLGALSPVAPEVPAGAFPPLPHTHFRFFAVIQDNPPMILDESLPIPIKVYDAATGDDAKVVGSVVVDGRTFERIGEALETREEFLQKNPLFIASVENTIVLPAGNYEFDHTIIVPRSLRLVIEPGTTVRMQKDVSVISYSPVTLVGSGSAPIRFMAAKQEEPWGVFGVLNAKEDSAVHWVEFSDGGQAHVNGVFYSGMLAFHNSPVSIANVKIHHAHGDDGLNLKYVAVDVQSSQFEENDADGLDIDMAPEGTITNCTFRNNRNDGIEIVWSTVAISTADISQNAEKCVNIAEQSTIDISDSTLRECHYGLAVKDGSSVQVQNVLFEKNAIGIGSYRKKIFFDPPNTDVSESTFTDNMQNISTASGARITVQ